MTTNITEDHRREIAVPAECRQSIARGALVAINHSGGKDSQAMTMLLSRIVPRDQLVAVHAPLGEIEWQGTVRHIEATLPEGVPLIFAPVTSGKTLLDLVEDRNLWPDPARRWCTASRGAHRCLRLVRGLIRPRSFGVQPSYSLPAILPMAYWARSDANTRTRTSRSP